MTSPIGERPDPATEQHPGAVDTDRAAHAGGARATSARREDGRFRAMVDHVPVILWSTDADGRCSYLNRRWQELTGQSPVEGRGEGWLQCLHPEDRSAARQVLLDTGAEAGKFRIQYRLRRPDGGWRWVVSAGAPRRAADGTFLGHVGSVLDIDEQKRTEQALRESEARLRRAQEAGGMGDWEMNLDTGALEWSDRLYRLLGLERTSVAPTLESALELIHPEDRGRVGAAVAAIRAGGGALDTEFRVLLPDGTHRWLASRAELVRDETGRPRRLVGVKFDVTERKLAEERICRLALQDPLTGLPNRRMLLGLLARELARAARDGGRIELFLVDLDEFKQVNDTLGHSAGDALLHEAARRLRGCVRERDHVARLGGDEFAVLVLDGAGARAGRALADRLVGVLRDPVELRGIETRPGASVGVAVWPDDAADAEALLAHADLALYAAKEAGRGTWRFFEPAMQDRARRAAALERDLRLACERDEFVLHYQPILDLASLRPCGLEALLRWRHPERGLVTPAEFLRAAERSRVIVPLTFWSLHEALRQAAAWRYHWPEPLFVAVNVATPALEREGLVAPVAARLRTQGLPASSLVVEVTEGAMVPGGAATAQLVELRQLGVRIAIDDFGAGYSSLVRLRDLPLDLLKIDRAFLEASGGTGEAILRAVVDLARSVGVTTVAEGVEGPDELMLLRRVGAAWAQGYLLAPPMPAEEVAAWLQARRKDVAAAGTAGGHL
jgi:diguanylate cyclase (GGDEF)-like protein/PAS domain S-box-containing protein